MCILKVFGCGGRQTSLRNGCIIIFIAKMMISLIYLSFLLSPYVKESWLYTFLIVWTVLAIAFWIALLTGALIMNSTIIAISLIGFILNLVTHISFQTVWSIKLFSDSDYMIVALGMIGFLIMVICMDIYYAWVLGSFCHELRNGQYGSALPYRN